MKRLLLTVIAMLVLILASCFPIHSIPISGNKDNIVQETVPLGGITSFVGSYSGVKCLVISIPHDDDSDIYVYIKDDKVLRIDLVPKRAE